MLTHTIHHADLRTNINDNGNTSRVMLPVVFTWPVRALLMLIAFAGSTVYAASYRLVETHIDLLTIATSIGIAAGTAWIGFGFILLTMAQMKPRRFARVSALRWADVCLVAMAIGMAIKMIGVALNVAMAGTQLDFAALASVQLALLLTADVVMGFMFTMRSSRLGLPPRHAVALWVAALNGIFAAVLAALLLYEGTMP